MTRKDLEKNGEEKKSDGKKRKGEVKKKLNTEGTEVAHRGHGEEVGNEADETVGCEGMGKR